MTISPLPLPHKHRHRSRDFLAAWIRSPLKMGSLLPSSRTLARAMAAEIDPDAKGAVVELGAGTGVVTHALLHTGIPPEKLVVIERDERLHELVCANFSGQLHAPNILCADALALDKALHDIGVKHVSAIVSSLPLLSMPKEVRSGIIEQMASVIAHDGVIVQFTYGPKSPIGAPEQRKYRLHGKRTKLVVTNVPPAHVWVYRKG